MHKRSRSVRFGITMVLKFVSVSLVWLACIVFALPQTVRSEDSSTATTDSSIDFDNGILPLLTKAGCNSGACHGAAVGRGGFQLSLYGQNPEQDWYRTTHELGGRRIHRIHPESSLLLRKGGELMDHGGGERLAPDSDSWNRIVAWIRAGAKRSPVRGIPAKMVGIHALPNQIQRKLLDNQPIQIQVTAHYDDGTSNDVSAFAAASAEDPWAVKVDVSPAGNPLITPQRVGRHVVFLRVRDKVTAIEVMVSAASLLDSPTHPLETKSITEFSYIDSAISERLHQLGLEPSPPLDDLPFLRRVTLDLSGRMPSKDEIESYVQSSPMTRRQDAIDRLLSADVTIDYWADRWLDYLQATPKTATNSSQSDVLASYRKYLRDQIASHTPVPEILSQLVTADGSIQQNGAVGFYLTARDGRGQAELFSESIMAVRMRCANCHDHPLDHWTQDDYHGLAALFMGIQRTPLVQWRSGSVNIHPLTGEPAPGRTPDRQSVAADRDPRPELAAFIQRNADGSIAKAWANRAWSELMGRGLMQPVDDLRDTNPATHPELLNALVSEWKSHQFDWLHLLRSIASSDVYRRSNLDHQSIQDEAMQSLLIEMYAARTPRPLSSDVLLSSLSQLTDNKTLLTTTYSNRAFQESLAGKLELLVGPLLNETISSKQGAMQRWIDQYKSQPSEFISHLYLHCLCRNPTTDEFSYWLAQLESTNDREWIMEDMIWSLLTCREFTTNH